LGELGYPAVIVCGPHAVAGLHVPPNVELRTGLTQQQCHDLLSQARVHVVSVDNMTTASGQVTLLDAMMMRCPTVATACPGTVDYVDDEVDALLVHPQEHEQLKVAISRLWEDSELRARLANRASRRMESSYSDEAVGQVMGEILDEVERKWEAGSDPRT